MSRVCSLAARELACGTTEGSDSQGEIERPLPATAHPRNPWKIIEQKDTKARPILAPGGPLCSFPKSNAVGSLRQNRPDFKQHRRNRLPDPHGHRSFLPPFSISSLSPWTIRRPRFTWLSLGKAPPAFTHRHEKNDSSFCWWFMGHRLSEYQRLDTRQSERFAGWTGIDLEL